MNTENKLRRLLPKRITLKRRRPPEDGTSRNNAGFSMFQLVVAMIIVAVLATIAGPPLWDQIFAAREQALNSNVQAAAEALQNTLVQNPELKQGLDDTTGEPSDAAIEAFGGALPVNWIGNAWELEDDDEEDDIRVQFILKGAVDAPDASSEAPEVTWLSQHGGAIRLHARNGDGAWGCALIVLTPSLASDETGYPHITNTATSTTSTVPVTASEAVSRVRGVWFDSGEGASTGVNDCSPVAVAAAVAGSSDEEPLPANNPTVWHIPDGDVNIGSDDRVLRRGFGD